MVHCEQERALTYRIDPLAAMDLDRPALLYGIEQVLGPVRDE
jgi:hypothetical protein